jgi:hypothetical protein
MGTEVAEIFRRYGAEYRYTHSMTAKQRRVMRDILQCRTSALGFHVDECDECGQRDIAYNSCRNRHCPKCQGIARRKWVKARLADLLPVPYYHVVFTLPHHLFPLSLYNQSLIYEFFFDSASETLLEFGDDPRWMGGRLGFWGMLHTWGQSLWQHIHGHFVVAGGGIGKDGRWVEPKHRGKFLFPVGALSKVFRGKFVEGLKTAYYGGKLVIPKEMEHLKEEEGFEKWVDELVSRDWVVYCKPPFGDAEQVVRYIGRYTHRVAISNRRILSIENGEICFRYKDYKKDRIVWEEMTLKAEEFIKRFLWHVLPDGFHKIRHYGFLANGRAKAMVGRIREVLSGQEEEESYDVEQSVPEGADGFLCRVCRKGIMVPLLIIDRWGRRIGGVCGFWPRPLSLDTT